MKCMKLTLLRYRTTPFKALAELTVATKNSSISSALFLPRSSPQSTVRSQNI